ncbi:uncharacterized protein FIBRA_06292 [Fibroporia radiculosa]|uniref:Uncharacterized protein n=1 Tax=Fibroporia radiculosa TaxID=599839 RepID=J4IB67_9APHY|nr:uncharacterized protein FIBRA_06292 [Fibroporia radiculosa]CCM04131.1 predicted protein [Fibroporia radiculosa]
MDTTRNDFHHAHSGRGGDEEQMSKKGYQVVDRPPVTDHDIHDEYLKHPPNNQPTELMTNRGTRGQKEGGRDELDPKREGVLGDEPTSRITMETALEETTTEHSVHP